MIALIHLVLFYIGTVITFFIAFGQEKASDIGKTLALGSIFGILLTLSFIVTTASYYGLH